MIVLFLVTPLAISQAPNKKKSHTRMGEMPHLLFVFQCPLCERVGTSYTHTFPENSNNMLSFTNYTLLKSSAPEIHVGMHGSGQLQFPSEDYFIRCQRDYI